MTEPTDMLCVDDVDDLFPHNWVLHHPMVNATENYDIFDINTKKMKYLMF